MQDYSYCGGHYRDHYFNQIFPQNAISWEIADARPRGERVRRYYEINLVIAWPRKKSGRSVLIKELEASAAPCQRLSGFPSISLFFLSVHCDRYRLRICHKTWSWWKKMVPPREWQSLAPLWQFLWLSNVSAKKNCLFYIKINVINEEISCHCEFLSNSSILKNEHYSDQMNIK